jgi:SAM-dependent methyltransferase
MIDPDAIRAFEYAGWEEAASTYEGSFGLATRPFIAGLVDAAKVGAGHSVLDVACGSGLAAAAAVARGAVARGVDFSPAMLGVARARHPAIPFDVGDAETLPYTDSRFDVVVCNFGIHHLPRPILALRQAYRVLSPGGSMAFTIWAAPEENIAWKLVFDAIRRCGDMTASRAPAPGGGFNAPADCSAALGQAGFTEIGSGRLNSVWRLANGAALLQALQSGTARMAALIGSQAASTLSAIAADIDRAAAIYRDGDRLNIPLAAYVAYGRKH